MPPKKRANNHELPKPMPLGEVLEDMSKKKWKLGKPIGKGGFGLIYLAQEFTEKKNNTEFPYVIKIEPHENGPLFVEMNFLMRNAKKEDISAFMTNKKLKSLGMPNYISSGSHVFQEERYRFLVLQRFGDDISKLFLECKKEFPSVTVFKVANQIVDVLEYIHSRGYVHHDIKGANILLDLKSKNQVYLLDYGLTGRYFTGPEFKSDPKKAHDGTPVYISRDGHNGVQTRRGDIEILGYNIIQWLGCTLPWEKIKTPTGIQKSKEQYMDDIPDLIKTCFKNKDPPKAVMEYFIYLNNLNFDSEPDYKKLRKILTNGIDSNGGTLKSPLVFTQSKTPTKRKAEAETPSSGKKPKLPRRKLNVNDDDNKNPEEEMKIDNKVEKAKKKVTRKNVANVDEDIENTVEAAETKKIENDEKPKRKRNAKDTANADEEMKTEDKVEKAKKKVTRKNVANVDEDIENTVEAAEIKNIENDEKPKRKRNAKNNANVDEENKIEDKVGKGKKRVTRKNAANVEDIENAVEPAETNGKDVVGQERTRKNTNKRQENKKNNEENESDVKIKKPKKTTQRGNDETEEEKSSLVAEPKSSGTRSSKRTKK